MISLLLCECVYVFLAVVGVLLFFCVPSIWQNVSVATKKKNTNHDSSLSLAKNPCRPYHVPRATPCPRPLPPAHRDHEIFQHKNKKGKDFPRKC